jgi:hypothetical protein
VALASSALAPILVGLAVWQLVAHAGSDSSRTVPTTLPSELATLFSDTAVPSPAADPPTPEAPQPPTPGTVLSPAGWTALTAAVRQQGGSTRVLEATAYPTYAVIGLPAKGGATERFRWDGSALRSFGTTPSFPGLHPVDLAAVNGTVVARLSARIRGSIAHPTTWYVILRTDSISGRPALYAYANNDAGHGGYLLATPAGEVQRTVKW